MIIQTENTPNPNALRFLPGKLLHSQNAQDFPKGSDTSNSPLATKILELENVEGVMIGQDFISVSKSANVEWSTLTNPIIFIISEVLSVSEAITNAFEPEALKGIEDVDFDPKDKGLVLQIQEILESRVRPAIAQDGGDMVFRAYKDGGVYLSMHGACAGCPSSTLTLKMGVENLLRHYFEDVQFVEQVL